MRRNTLLLIFLASGLPVFAAGVRMQSEMTDLQTGAVTKMDMLVEPSRLRINMVGPKSSNSVLFLTDGGRDRIVMLNTVKNEYMEIDKATVDKMAAQMQGLSGQMAQMQAAMEKMKPEQRAAMEKLMKGRVAAAPAAAGKIVYTNKGGTTVNGFPCTKYDGMSGGTKVQEVCAAAYLALRVAPADFYVFDRMRQFTAGITKAAASSQFGSLADFTGFTDPGFTGIPVSSSTFSAGKATRKTEVKSVQNTNIANSEFSLGTATKREMPSMPRPK